MSEKKNLGSKLAAVSGKNVCIDAEKHYDSWAKKYEKELLEDYGYCAHRIGSEAFANYERRKSCEVIDVGCGTGLVGEELKLLGQNGKEYYFKNFAREKRKKQLINLFK